FTIPEYQVQGNLFVIFSSIQKRIQNRPVDHRLPVLFRSLLFLILALSLSPDLVPVQAQSSIVSVSGISPTPTPEAKTIIPASGEPVILQPGNNARLISPLKLQLMTQPGDDGLIRVELIGQDNRLIFRKLMDYRAYKGKTILIEQEIPFEIREDESARLQVVLEDARGKMTFLTSLQLTLLMVRGSETSGEAPINPRFKIEQPLPDDSVDGDSLKIECGVKPINDTPIIIEILATDGRTLEARFFSLDVPADQTAFTPVAVNLPYKVSIPTPVTLRIRQESNSLIKGTVLLWSELITLNP
ncbi:MAG TPA: hypothetical protein VF338_03770, partial [Leptolinea sp.]